MKHIHMKRMQSFTRKAILIVVFLWGISALVSANNGVKQNKLPYQKSTTPIEQRVADLLSRMTLEEKAMQMDMYSAGDLLRHDKVDDKVAGPLLKRGAPGVIHDFYPKTAAIANEVQRYFIEHNRLHIPLLYVEEGLHGYQGSKSTAFPVSLGMGSMFDPALVEEIGHAIGEEARSVGVHMLLSPVLGLGREPRWGRIQETYGEDPYLTAENGVSFIKGMQGNSLTDDDAVAAEPKHYGVHSIPEGGCNAAPVYIGRRMARSTFLVPFERAFREAGALATMAAYHEWDGIPSSSNPFLLKQLLRKEWGFKGFVLADLGAVSRLENVHHTAANPAEAVQQAIENGLDMQFYDYPHDVFQNAVIDGVNENKLSIEAVNRAVSSILYVKFRLGLFDNPYTDEGLKAKRYHNQAHQGLALRAAQESMILLQNKNKTLPIAKEQVDGSTKRKTKIALIGRYARQCMLGGYSPKEVQGSTIKQAFEQTDLAINYVDLNMPVNGKVEFDSYLCHTVDGELGFRREFFNNTDFSGKPVYEDHTMATDVYWHNLSPVGGVNKDNFSIRMTSTMVPTITGDYTITCWADEFLKLQIGDQIVFDQFTEIGKERTTINLNSEGTVHLIAGKSYPISISYIEETMYAGFGLKWAITPDKDATEDLYGTAIEAAKKSDYIVLVLGENNAQTGEGKDRMNLHFSHYNTELIAKLSVLDKPLVLVLQNGRPLMIPTELEHTDAVLETWYAGEMGGEATVNILLGDVNPSGRLPVTMASDEGQLPLYYYQKRTAGTSYVDGSAKPLFPFGFGLSYSTFEYSNLKIDSPEITKDGIQSIRLTISNESDIAGTAVPQLYITDEVSSVTTPKLLLKGVKRVDLAAHESKVVTFNLPISSLTLWNRDMKRVVESGTFTLHIGASSADIKLTDTFEVK